MHVAPVRIGRRGHLIVSSWNVEGLTDIKIEEITTYMLRNSIDVLCIQETRKPYADTYRSEKGFLLLLSGRGDASREYAGVGFVVAPWMQPHIMGFTPNSSRCASLKLRVQGGCMALFSVYAPHTLHPLSDRIAFYDELERNLQRVSVNGVKLIFGDLNARLGRRKAGEQQVLGEFCFGRELQSRVDTPNRDLLLEFCTCFGYAVANTLMPQPDYQQVTYHEPRVGPLHPISEENFSVLDLLLAPADWAHRVTSVCSDRFACIASHHFVVTAVLDVNIEQTRKVRPLHRNWRALDEPELRRRFLQDASHLLHGANVSEPPCNPTSQPVVISLSDCLAHQPEEASAHVGGCDGEWMQLRSCLLAAADRHLPTQWSERRKPWLSDWSLHLLHCRTCARETGNWQLERELHRSVRKSVKADRTRWLNDRARTGDWDALRSLRKPRQPKQTRLHDASNNTVSTSERADTFANYLECVQWRVRDVPPHVARLVIHSELSVCVGPILQTEARNAIVRLSSGKAVKEQDVAIECFKAMACGPGAHLQQFVSLLNTCWDKNAVPQDWLQSRVAMIYKKKDPALPENYRPICLTSTAYRIYASIIKQRLLDAGLDAYLWPSQFGFRKHRSTLDAIYVARRHIELACAQRHGQVSLLALDWKGAFDSVHVGRLLDALRRFGVPLKIREVVEGLMRERQFYVVDHNETSSTRPQRSGISQGCTLSPLLFIIVMSVVMTDAVALLPPLAKAAYDEDRLSDLVYADDTLLIGSSTVHLHSFLEAVRQAGAYFGLELHSGKFQLLQVQTHERMVGLEGEPLPAASSLGYLGAALAADGSVGNELNRRIGAAKSDFITLRRVRSHATLPRKRKLYIFQALIESKLLYGLSAACFTKAELRRLDGFQARCLRQIIGIKPAFYSRISNASVLEKAGFRSASKSLLLAQLQQLGRVMRADSSNPIFVTSFFGTHWQFAVEHYVRRIGRPRKEWVPEAFRAAMQVAGGLEQLERAVADSTQWKQQLRRAKL